VVAVHFRVLRAALLTAIYGCSSAPPAPSPENTTLAPTPPSLGDATSRPPTEAESATATVRLHYPKAAGITLRGDDLLAGEIACAPDPTNADTCTFTIEKFPRGQKSVAVRPYRGGAGARGARWIVTRGETIDLYPHFTSERGELKTLIPAFHSAVLNTAEPDNERLIYAYLPASYGENPTARYPVVYMHDGRNLFEASSSITGAEWQVDESADDAWERTGAFAEAIIIGIDQLVTVSGTLTNQRQREYNPTPTALPVGPPTGNEYATMVATELKPAVDALLRTRPGRESTAVLGSSLGGTISTWIAQQYPQVFARYASMSPATAIDLQWLVGQLTPTSPKLLAIYFDVGTLEGDPISQFMQAYRRLGYADGAELQSFVELGGQHSETDWARRLPATLGFLLPDRREQ
jgi:predicted alpha/beta superfamily hydrolase